MAEITEKSPFGKAMSDTILRYKINNVLEIGAFDGDGSTLVLAGALSLKRGPVSLTSIESDRGRFENLCRNLALYSFAQPVCASSIGRNSFTAWDFETDVWASPYNGIRYAKEEVRSWHSRDVELIREIDVGFLEQSNSSWDAALVDGGEFCGYDEFRLLKDRVLCFFLDDAYAAFKTNRARCELEQDTNWRREWCSEKNRNGAAIFVHRSLATTGLSERLAIGGQTLLRRS